MKYNKLETMLWWIFAGIGAIFIVIGIILFVGIIGRQNRIYTKGTISKISTYTDIDGYDHDEVMVEYEANGKSYESRLNVCSTSFYEGKELNIYYDKNNPRVIGMKGFDYLFLIFPGIGLIFAIIGVSGLVVIYRKRKMGVELMKNGEKVFAEYVETVRNLSVMVNGRHPYNIICAWKNPVDGKRYLFKSKNIWFNPEMAIQENNAKLFAVYYDANNMKKYVVDVDWLTDEVVDLG